MHVAHLDHMRHVPGVYGREIEEALMVHDDWLGRILDEVKEAGLDDFTNIAVVSDHGHLAVKRMFPAQCSACSSRVDPSRPVGYDNWLGSFL